MYVNLHPVAIHIRRNLRGLTYEWPFNYEGIRLGGIINVHLIQQAPSCWTYDWDDQAFLP